MKILIYSFIILLISACVPESSKEDNIFDPGDLGGSNGGQLLYPLINFSATLDENYQTLITYTVPSLYEGQEYQIKLYRIEGDGIDFSLPDPTETYSSAYLYSLGEDIPDEGFKDPGTIVRGKTYTYYGYIYLNGKWSEEKKQTVVVPAYSDVTVIPRNKDFWDMVYTQDYQPESYGMASINTISSNSLVLPEVDQANAIAYSEDGFTAYKVDTARNRIMIYENSSAKTCLDFEGDQREFCLASVRNIPLSPVAVLGQKNFTTDYDCEDPLNELPSNQCLTAPRDIIVYKDSLVVTTEKDIRIYDRLPQDGCWNIQNESGQPTAADCDQDRIIGKKSFDDETVYSLEVDGNKALFCPTGLAARDNDLIISEKCNNRILIAKKVFIQDGSKFKCSYTNWGTSSCRFENVLGQSDFFSNYSLADRLSLEEDNPHHLRYDIVENKFIPEGTFEKICSSPTQIKFLKSGRFLAVCQEDFSLNIANKVAKIESRVQVWETLPILGSFPLCSADNPVNDTTGNFLSEDRCKSDFTLGLPSGNSPNLISSDAVYGDGNIEFTNIRVAEMDGMLIAAESANNNILIWDDFIGNNSPTPFFNSKIRNPNGDYNSDGSKVLPILYGLGNIYWNEGRRRLIVQDVENSLVYELNFDQRI